MQERTSVGQSLAEGMIDRVDSLLRQAEDAEQPVELNPFHDRLFEVFVTAEAAGYLSGNGDADLTADGLCRVLAERWGLAESTRDSFEQQTKLPTEQLAKMRLLWSMMRMWMEWTYAWKRWPEFHADDTTT